jgi:hypothetical protein
MLFVVTHDADDGWKSKKLGRGVGMDFEICHVTG